MFTTYQLVQDFFHPPYDSAMNMTKNEKMDTDDTGTT